MIHLKVRTEFSFRQTFAPLSRVIERLKEVGATAAGMVDADGSTWGHVRWEAECARAGITPLFGAEIGISDDPERSIPGPTAWALATTPSALYELVSNAHRHSAAGQPSVTRQAFLDAPGLVKFSGSAFRRDSEAIEAGVLIDLNPGSVMGNREALALHRRTGGEMVLVGDNAFAFPSDKKLFELSGRGAKATPQHILTLGELRSAFPFLEPEQIEAALQTSERIAGQLKGVALRKAPIIKLEGDVLALCREGQAKRLAAGQIAAWTEEYEARLLRELALVEEKQFSSYFLMVADMVAWAKARMLVGPARGSSAGSLACYLMGITEVDPIPYGLLFERFVDVTRTDLPDIDIDFPDTTRDSIYVYLAEKYGTEKVARIGTISEYKAKSALGEVAKRLGIPPWETQAVKDAMFERSSADSRANNCLADTLNETEPGKSLVERFPAIVLAGEIEGHASHSGVHAAGVIVCNEPITEFCAVANGVAQLDKVDAEKLNLLKIDVLGLRTLSVIQDAGVISREDIYNLKFDDPAVFNILNEGRFSGIFQWEGQALQSLTSQITVSCFEDMAHITALARPGPLGGGAAERFTLRHAGRERVDVAHPSMLPYLAETYGLVLYQEQVIRIAREIGGLSWKDTTDLRKAMSKSMGKEFFDRFGEKFAEGAAQRGLSKQASRDIWDSINSMGAWAFNKSHSVAYAIVSYWTAWIKVHHPLEFAAASLCNAKDEDTALALLREIVSEGTEYIPFDLELSELNWTVKDGKLIGGFLGIKGVGPAKAKEMMDARASEEGMTEKMLERLERAEFIYGELYPARQKWGAYYDDPESMGLQRGSVVMQIADLPEQGGEVVILGMLKKKDARDHNEARYLEKRKGKRRTGPTAFLDMRISDDSSLSPLLVRVDRFEYEPTGRMILDRGKEDHDWFLVRGEKLRGIPMVSASRVRCLSNPDFFKEKKE